MSLFHHFVYASKNIDSLLLVLDNDIKRAQIFENKKEKKINDIKKLINNKHDTLEGYKINLLLYNEYKSYSADSALYYLSKNEAIARNLRNSKLIIDTSLEQAYILTRMGLYLEAKDKLEAIDRNKLDRELKKRYYLYYKDIYIETANALPGNKYTSPYYRKLGMQYRDSLLGVLSKTDDTYYSERMFIARENKNYNESFYWNNKRIKKFSLGEPKFALIAYNNYTILQLMGRQDDALYYLILSAISDVRSAIKEQSSIMRLSELLYNRGDIKRANMYINYSLEITKTYNTRMRNCLHIRPFSNISNGFLKTISKQNLRLSISLILIIFLAFLLIVLVIYVYIQIRRLRIVKNELQVSNNKLNIINHKLEEVNECLNITNIELLDSNKIKETYIAHFFKLSSTYLGRIDRYRKLINKKLQKKEYKELLKLTSPTNNYDIVEQEELYLDFDTAFLKLYPNFIESINSLLHPGEKFELQKGEMLNTELRICALIRLGFSKSSQIAELLHYSPSTIYNYRTRLRERAIDRNGFEENLKAIN